MLTVCNTDIATSCIVTKIAINTILIAMVTDILCNFL